MVGKEGLEPSRLIQPTDFKSVAYTNSATLPGGAYRTRTGLKGFADLCVTSPPTRRNSLVIIQDIHTYKIALSANKS